MFFKVGVVVTFRKWARKVVGFFASLRLTIDNSAGRMAQVVERLLSKPQFCQKKRIDSRR
jgi:hypothetical protein